MIPDECRWHMLTQRPATHREMLAHAHWLQVLVNALWRGSSASDAVGLPRLHHQFLPNKVFAENWQMGDGGWQTVPPVVVDGLRARGHEVERWTKHATTQLVLQANHSSV
jgi:gamma-glutamyltranspeptidase